MASTPHRTQPQSLELSRQTIDQAYLVDETTHVRLLYEYLSGLNVDYGEIGSNAVALVERVRARSLDVAAMEAFMREYDLSSEEGVILMCLAEALLRIPDNETAEALIADKLSDAHWEEHLGKSESVFVNASTWGLMLTGKIVRLREPQKAELGSVIGRLVARSGEPVIRGAIRQAMKIMGHQYVMGESMKDALKRSEKKANQRFRYSFDMLGEAALTAQDAVRYKLAYQKAIEHLGKHTAVRQRSEGIFEVPSISIKLSALHPRYHPDQSKQVVAELSEVILELATLARASGVAVTLDAEEADRLDQSLAIFESVLGNDALVGWDGLGLAVQAYQRRAWYVIDHLLALASKLQHRIPVRLVKGAYWDTEIKLAQMEGLETYPVFTRKASTDLSYLACAHKLLAHPEAFYPQFATHNAHTICAIQAFAGTGSHFEYQRLHGMGVELYDEVLDNATSGSACRVYAPVGAHKDLLPYLVRRLLENGANTSFVNRIVDESIDADQVISDPLVEVAGLKSIPHPKIPSPRALYGTQRLNSLGLNLASQKIKRDVETQIKEAGSQQWEAQYLGSVRLTAAQQSYVVKSPFNLDHSVGTVCPVDPDHLGQVVLAAKNAQKNWNRVSVADRARVLEAMADLLESNCSELISLCVWEAGKSLRDGLAEVREAIDFCRYYAEQARNGLSEPVVLPGPTGELNHLTYHGRGVFVCISPWNFPLAIFVGQVAAALVTGNAVIAKPAEQTSLMAARAVRLFYQAGIPQDVLHLVPGGSKVGQSLTSDVGVAGVAFTGSTETAKLIAQTLVSRDAPLATLIAETGGQNAMIVDSSALPEQVVRDVISSAFLSAGQRCSALRVLCLQNEIAPTIVSMLSGAMNSLKLGEPHSLASDIGPIIDEKQWQILKQHAEHLELIGTRVGEVPMPKGLPKGHWFAPIAYEIDSIRVLEREIFGPVLHIVRYNSRALDTLINEINETGYGLTLGVHSRIDRVQRYISSRVHVGNCYINRNMTGAVVGVQPFGGEGLSGTGPKAGGPNYLFRFSTERVVTTNTAAVGGNASLIALSDD